MSTEYLQKKKENQHELLVKIASMYYKDDLSQLEISKQLGISRSNVSKLLKSARDSNIVDIRINDVSSRTFGIAERLRERFDLKSVILAPSNTDSEVNLSNIGLAAAKHLESIIEDNMKIGISWGASIYHMIFSLAPVEKTNIKVIQLMGGLHWSNSYKDGIQLIMRLSERLGADARSMNAPLILRSKEVKDMLMEESYLQEHMKLMENVDIAVVGIGTTNPDLSRLVDSSMITKENMALLWESGIKAHICGQYIDIGNQSLASDFNDRTIAIPIEQLKKIPTVMGIAGGEEKVEPIVDALRGNYIDTLITDEKTAMLVDRLTQ